MRIFAAIAVGVITVAGSAAAIAESATLERVRETRTLTLGYRADAKPYSYADAQALPAGYMVDLCNEVAAKVAEELKLPIRPKFVEVGADERFVAVRDKRIDLLCDPSSITLARRENVDFSIPAFVDGAGVVFRMDRPVGRFEDFAGRRIGVLANTTSDHMLRRSLDALGLKANVVAVADHRAGFDLLAADKVDAYFADRGIIQAILREGQWPGLKLGKSYFSYETYALVLARGDDDFRLLVDRTLARLYRNGRISELLARSFGQVPDDSTLGALFLIHGYPER